VVIRLWVIIDAAAYTTCRIDVMHFSLQDSCIEAAKRAYECKSRANWRKQRLVDTLTDSQARRVLHSRAMSHDYSPQEVSRLHDDGAIQLIDVRAGHEHEAGHIAGTTLIELSEISSRAGEIDRERPVVFYCRSGARSAMATEAFAQAGYDAHNMAGGMLAWEAAGLPIDPDGGFVADP
jgi:rhodanese-related sulfurtransferase